VLLGPIISRFFACSNEEKKLQRVLALVLSLCRQVVCLVRRDYEKVCESCGGDEVVRALKVPLTYHDG
jgi:hypothetical protein